MAAFKILFYLVLLFCISCSGQSSERTALVDDISASAAEVIAETGVPAVSIYIISPTYGDLSIATGVAEMIEQRPVASDQPFRIGSLTKSFTAAAVLKLVERGQIDLDAPISDYLGVVENYAPVAGISVRQLMNMSSGLAPYLDLSYMTGTILAEPNKPRTPTELLQHAFDSSPNLEFEPGTAFHYTNTNYILLGMLIESVSGLSYREFLEQTFIIPLGLQDTVVAIDNTYPADLVRGYYDFDEDGSYEDWTEMHMSFVWSAGCLISTARDVAVWMDALARGTLFDQALWPDLYQGQYVDEGVSYTAGIGVDENFAIGHNGTVIGYHADAWHNPHTGDTVAVLSNTNAPLLDDERDPTREIVDEVFALLSR